MDLRFNFEKALQPHIPSGERTREIEQELLFFQQRFDQLRAYHHVVSGEIEDWETHPLNHVYDLSRDFKVVLRLILSRLNTITSEDTQDAGVALAAFLDQHFARTNKLVLRMSELGADAMQRVGRGGRQIDCVKDSGDAPALSRQLLTMTWKLRGYSATFSYVYAQIAAMASAAKCLDDAAFLAAALVMGDLRKDVETEDLASA